MTDPATSDGFAEIVSTTEYDALGRATAAFVPCFDGASDSRAPHCSALATLTGYDGLGRITQVTPPGLPPTTTSYAGLTVTVTDANGNLTRTTSDILGHVVAVERYWNTTGEWLASRNQVDAEGQVRASSDPAGNTLLLAYDGLGRKIAMNDPDLGAWYYAYDENGNLVGRSDAKGQQITMYYDPLNRLTLKDLPPAGPGSEDVYNTYDGNVAPTCYSCDDHDPSTGDSCDPSTLTCTHTPGVALTECTTLAASIVYGIGDGMGTDVSCTGSCTIRYQTDCPNTQLWVSGYLEGGFWDVRYDGGITNEAGYIDQYYEAPASTQAYTGMQFRREGSSVRSNPINVTLNP
jgi:YD repeat-containing protein